MSGGYSPSKVGAKIYVAANAVLNQVHRQKMALLEKAGVNLEAPPPPDIPIDERGLHHVLSLKASLAEIMVAAGVDPNTPLEDAVDEFGDVLDRNFGPVGSEGRTALSKAIENGFRKGREAAGLTEDEAGAE